MKVFDVLKYEVGYGEEKEEKMLFGVGSQGRREQGELEMVKFYVVGFVQIWGFGFMIKYMFVFSMYEVLDLIFVM